MLLIAQASLIVPRSSDHTFRSHDLLEIIGEAVLSVGEGHDGSYVRPLGARRPVIKCASLEMPYFDEVSLFTNG